VGLSIFLAHVNQFIRMRQTKALQNVHSAERFRVILERERARADRNGHQFSVVAFDIDSPEVNNANAKQLASILLKRIRFTDELGWFDNHRIAALLPETTTAGAITLAENVCQIFTATTSPPKYTIHSYPPKKSNRGDGHSGPFHIQDIPSKRKTTTSQRFPASTKHSASEHSPSALEQMFCCPLPIWKRAVDVVGASVGLVVLSPILLLVALIIKIVSPGPVFFKQQRVGHMGEIFTMWKFRTMRVNSDTSVHQRHLSKLIKSVTHNDELTAKPMTKLDDDPQIIPFGKILRKTCLDELPQLFNVLRGEMSLVGPRPPLPYEVEEYLLWHNGRINTVPGMTGLWQVSGKNRLTFNKMVRLDIQYWRKKSLWLDIKILLKTPLAIVSQIRDTFTSRKSKRLIGEL